MAHTPILTFKAGTCSTAGRKVTPNPTPGYLYLYNEEDMLHLCWRPRSAPASEPELDLLMIPGDGTFQPLVKNPGADNLESPTNGRIFVLRFQSSSQKHYFWMQSKTQHKDGKLGWFGERDKKLGTIVDSLLQGESLNIQEELAEVGGRSNGGGDGNGEGGADREDNMDLDPEPDMEAGGAGQDATGGDPREEGEASREGGADGARAATAPSIQPQDNDTDALVQNFLNSLQGNNASSQQVGVDKPYTTLPELLSTNFTIPFIESASPQQIDTLCSFLPPELFLLAQESETSTSFSDPEPTIAVTQAAIEALSIEQKVDILKRTLRSPQFHQSLGSLTVALRDGGLPMIGEALGLKVENGGLIRGGSMPLGGGNAVEAFVQGVRKTVEKEEKNQN
ncbi:hypothetical protein M433DRAFT_158630 [Acidomyces richmondensis BFW]|nr:hypothetical protein M433DRAFT_158630 [Acidomyces richmondensis BFW]